MLNEIPCLLPLAKEWTPGVFAAVSFTAFTQGKYLCDGFHRVQYILPRRYRVFDSTLFWVESCRLKYRGREPMLEVAVCRILQYLFVTSIASPKLKASIETDDDLHVEFWHAPGENFPDTFPQWTLDLISRQHGTMSS